MSAVTDILHELIEVVAGRTAILSDDRADELHAELDAAQEQPAAPAEDAGYAPEPADAPGLSEPQGSL